MCKKKKVDTRKVKLDLCSSLECLCNNIAHAGISQLIRFENVLLCKVDLCI